VTPKITVYWAVTPYCLINMYRSFKENLWIITNAAGSSETSVHIKQNVRHHRPENDHIHNHKTYLETTRFLRWFFQLTPQSSVLRDKLIIAQLFKKFLASYVIRTYISLFTKVAFWFLSWPYDTKFFMAVYIHTVVISSVTTYNYLPKYTVS
jgi:hypothetical protein